MADIAGSKTSFLINHVILRPPQCSDQVAKGVEADIPAGARNDVNYPKPRFATVNCRIAKGLFNQLVAHVENIAIVHQRICRALFQRRPASQQVPIHKLCQ
jgi:hypothetical protein